MSLHLDRFNVPVLGVPCSSFFHPGQGHLAGVNNLIWQKKIKLHFSSYLKFQTKIKNGSIRSVGVKMSDSVDSLI